MPPALQDTEEIPIEQAIAEYRTLIEDYIVLMGKKNEEIGGMNKVIEDLQKKIEVRTPAMRDALSGSRRARLVADMHRLDRKRMPNSRRSCRGSLMNTGQRPRAP